MLDVVRAWHPPFSATNVVREASEILKSYRCSQVVGDDYGAGLVIDHFRQHGIKFVSSERNRSEIFLTLLPFVNSRAVRLLNLPEVTREFVGLQRFRGVAGKDRVDHPRTGHDDMANASAGALVLVAVKSAGFDAGRQIHPVVIDPDLDTRGFRWHRVS